MFRTAALFLLCSTSLVAGFAVVPRPAFVAPSVLLATDEPFFVTDDENTVDDDGFYATFDDEAEYEPSMTATTSEKGVVKDKVTETFEDFSSKAQGFADDIDFEELADKAQEFGKDTFDFIFTAVGTSVGNKLKEMKKEKEMKQ